MIKKRIIPCLLKQGSGFVKTVGFKDSTYLGDPLNILRLFNEKEADEILLLDIDATAQNKEPDYDFIEDVASECFMPLCYGGGVTSVAQMKRIFALGVEKIALSSVLVSNVSLLQEASEIFGKQSVVAVMDVKKTLFGRYTVCTHNGKKKTGLDPVEFAEELERYGAGEIVVNSINNDGKMQGYDTSLLQRVASSVSVPTIALGGAGKLDDMLNVIDSTDCFAASAGSLFVYSGVHKAVLINYPHPSLIV